MCVCVFTSYNTGNNRFFQTRVDVQCYNFNVSLSLVINLVELLTRISPRCRYDHVKHTFFGIYECKMCLNQDINQYV